MVVVSDCIEDLSAGVNALQCAVIGLLERAAAAHFKCDGQLIRTGDWPSRSAQARSTVIYVLVTDLGFTRGQAGAFYSGSERSARQAISRIIELRDNTYAFDFWLSDLSNSVRRQ
jgi:hypothetical protein